MILDHAVLHDLDGRGREPPGPTSLAGLEQVVHLFDPPVTVPPQRADHAGGELSRRGELRVRVERRVAAPHVRILPGRDPQRMQVALCDAQPLNPIGQRRVGDVSLDQEERSLVHGARGFAGFVADDPPVDGVRRLPRQAGDLERSRVRPRAVAVPARQVDGTVADDGVQDLLRRVAPGEDVHGPAAADDPPIIRMRRRVLRDDPLVVLHRVRLGQVAVQHLEPARRRMHVGVLEPGEQHPSTEVQNLRPATHELADVVVRADRDDASCGDRDRARPASGGVDRVDRPVHEGEVGVAVRCHLTRSLLSASSPSERAEHIERLASSGERDELEQLVVPEGELAVGHHQDLVGRERPHELDVVADEDHRARPPGECLGDGGS